jgi:hypothetical protein
MKVSRRWIEWAHGPGAEEGQPLPMRLCDLAGGLGTGSMEVAGLVLIMDLVDVAGILVKPCRACAWRGRFR